jgi:hypothetical protein
VERYAEEAAERLGRLGEIDPDACRSRVERLFSKRTMVQGYERVFETAVRERS